MEALNSHFKCGKHFFDILKNAATNAAALISIISGLAAPGYLHTENDIAMGGQMKICSLATGVAYFGVSPKPDLCAGVVFQDSLSIPINCF